ncbi:uncharacterized protein LOC133737842 [Rosa rugosa]|uniref:uncharacterized protein LOC133737842 n=1 Tax=Rosa rugosa TaxID=74645 RepID=UPI002B40437C|nr:uncharacterized protein LOC133737842 [Rosa rugosa]
MAGTLLNQVTIGYILMALSPQTTLLDVWIIPCHKQSGLEDGMENRHSPKDQNFHVEASEKKWVLTLVSFLCWAIWKARCDYVYRHRQPSPSQVLCYAVSLACEFLEASVQNRIGGAPLSDNINQWTLPPQNAAAINCDASWKSPSTGGLGTIIRDYRGMVICGATFNTCSGSVIIAEAQAILLDLNLAIEHNLKRVRVESDSLEAITKLRKANSCGNWRISPIIGEIHKKSQFFDHITWDWIPREANRVAHEAASLAIQSVGLNRWANRPPPSLSTVLRNDGLPCPHGNDS